MAGIGELPETILDRAVVIRMRRRAPTESLTPFRYRKARPRGEALRDRIAAWVHHHLDELAEAEPEMPPGIADRPADVWESLLAVADAVGGDWPDRARAAAVELEAVRRSASVSQGAQLLADIRTILEQAEPDRIWSEDLCTRLAALDESPWGDLRGRAIDPRGLASRLRPYDVRPHDVRIGEHHRKGYTVEDFHDAWTRYLPPPPERATSATRDTPATETMALTSDVADVADVADLGEGTATVPDDERDKASVRGTGRYFNGLEVKSDTREAVAARIRDYRAEGHADETVGILLTTDGTPPPPGIVNWTGYAVRAFMGEASSGA